eukprot:136619-Prorocentrum_minimum.AAC.1
MSARESIPCDRESIPCDRESTPCDREFAPCGHELTLDSLRRARAHVHEADFVHHGGLVVVVVEAGHVLRQLAVRLPAEGLGRFRKEGLPPLVRQEARHLQVLGLVRGEPESGGVGRLHQARQAAAQLVNRRVLVAVPAPSIQTCERCQGLHPSTHRADKLAEPRMC